jgi:hypothetical protein
VVEKTEDELRKLGLEHPDYWLTADELASGIKPGEQRREQWKQ